MQALRNKALKERHWTKIFEAIGQILDRGPTFTLQVRPRPRPANPNRNPDGTATASATVAWRGGRCCTLALSKRPSLGLGRVKATVGTVHTPTRPQSPSWFSSR